jgi:hypothetical protein
MIYYYSKKELTMKKISAFQYAGIFLLLLFIGSSFGLSSALKINNFIEKVPIIIRPNQEVLNEKNLRNEIKKLNLKYEDVIIAQYKIESNEGKSHIFKENNNFLGLKEAKLRPTTALGTNLGHAFYSDWRNCLIDYSLWQLSNTRSINSQEEYIQLLGSIYAEDQSYMDKINKLLNKK